MAQRDTTVTTQDWRESLLAGITRRPAGAAAPNRLRWPGYDGRAALWWGTGPVEGVDAVVAVWDFAVYGGSFGEADADAFLAAAATAAATRRPLVSLPRSGGTRLQEGVAGLVGLARVSLALADLAAAGVAHIAVSDQPTTGGMWVTVGSRADLRCAVFGATVGFAGPRVVEAVTGAAPPPDSHTATAAYEAGLVDAVVEPAQVGAWLRRALGAVAPGPDLRAAAGTGAGTGAAGPRPTPVGSASPAAAGRTGWEQVGAARGGDRRDGVDILRDLLPDGVDLTGPDRTVAARVGQLGRVGGPGRPGGLGRAGGPGGAGGAGGAGAPGPRVVGVALAARRGQAPGPDGYRLLTRAARLAGRLGLPLVTLVDTPGAACGAAAEAGGVAAAIGAAMTAVLDCPSPTLALVLGEGGSGGALAACCADVVLLSPDGYVTALSPEGTSTTLRVPLEQAADTAGLRPADLVALGFADGVLPRSATGASAATDLTLQVVDLLEDLTRRDKVLRLRERKAKWSTGLRGSL